VFALIAVYGSFVVVLKRLVTVLNEAVHRRLNILRVNSQLAPLYRVLMRLSDNCKTLGF
jgi:hypothetical protein